MQINLKKLTNPYSIFVISWSSALLLYSLNWAGIFPVLSGPLLMFLLICIITFLISGVISNRINITTKKATKGKFKYKGLILINTILWVLNFIYSKEVPLLNGLRDDNFGIPTVLVFTISLNTFCSVYCFYLFLISGKRFFLIFTVYCLMFFVLLISRGHVLMALFTMFFLWIIVKQPILTLKKSAVIITFLFLIIYLFGVAGNLRTIKGISSVDPSADNSYNSQAILAIGQASDSFNNSFIPGEFFWTYLYVTSPLSNLQYNISLKTQATTPGSLFSVFINEIIFDSASKRINQVFDIKPLKPVLITDALTVCTTLAGSYVISGWGGMVFFMLIFWMFPVIYKLATIKNPLGVIGSATLCTIYFFSMFDNMFIISALITVLLLPFVVNFFNKVNFYKPSIPGFNVNDIEKTRETN